MPLIPTADVDVVHAPKISPEAIALPFRGMERAGAEMADLGQKIGEAEYKVKSLTIESQMKSAFRQFDDYLSVSNDYEKFDEETDKFISTARDNFLSMAKGNKNLETAIGFAFNAHADELSHKKNMRKIKLLGEVATIEMDRKQTDLVQAMASEDDELKRTQLLNGYKAEWESLIYSGLVTRKEAAKAIEPVEEQVAELTVRNKLALAPGSVEQKLEWLSKQDYQSLGLKPEAYNRIKSDLKLDWSIEKQYKKDFEKQQTEAVDKTLAEFYSTYDFTDSAKVKQIEKTILTAPGIKDRASKIKQLKKFTDDPENFKKDDPIIYNQLMDRAKNNDPTLTVDEVDKYLGNGLSVKGDQKIKDVIRKDAKDFEDTLIDNAEASIKKAIFPQGELFVEDYQARSQQLYYALAMLENEVKTAKEQKKDLGLILLPQFDQQGKQINTELLTDKIIKTFAPKKETYESDYNVKDNKTNTPPPPPKGFISNKNKGSLGK